jgi:hypothetical protein
MRYLTREITPADAQKFLDARAPNRGISQGFVDSLARDMQAGTWRITGVPIILNDKNELIDGQHRMAAIVQSGKVVTMTVCYGVSDPHAQRNIDVGRKRPTGTVLSMFEGIPSANRTTAVLRCMEMLRRDSANTLQLSIDTILSMLAKSPGCQWVMSQPDSIKSSRKSSAAILAAFAIAFEFDKTKTEAAFRAFMDGLFPSRNDPLNALSRWLDNPQSKVGTQGDRNALGRRTLTALAYRFQGYDLNKSADGTEGMTYFKVAPSPMPRKKKSVKE